MTEYPASATTVRARSLLTGITTGQWKVHDFGSSSAQEPESCIVYTGEFDWEAIGEGDFIVATPMADAEERSNAEFIAAAPQLVADLADENDQLLRQRDESRAEVERLRAELEHIRRPKPDAAHPLEIRHGWLVEAGHEPDLIDTHGYLPDSDAVPLLRLDDLPGWQGT